MATFSRASTAIAITLSGVLAVSCAATRGPDPAPSSTPSSVSTRLPPETESEPTAPILSLSEAQVMVEGYAAENTAAIQEANESHSAEPFRGVDTGPMMLYNEFTVLANERLGRIPEPSVPWTQTVDQVWSAPTNEDFPRWVLIGSVHTPPADSGDESATPTGTAAPTQTAPPPVERLTAWVQEGPEGPWLKWAQAPVDLSDLAAPDLGLLSRETRDAHRRASAHLLAYLRGHDARLVRPDEQLEEFRNFAYDDPGLHFSRSVAPVRNRLDLVHPDGSILAVSTVSGSLGLMAVRSVQRTWVEGRGLYIELEDDDLRIALGLPERPWAMEQKQLITIAYHFDEGGGIVHVLGSDFRRIV